MNPAAVIVPALPEPSGPDLRRATFYREAAGDFEFLALWHQLPKEAQDALKAQIHAAAAIAAQAQVDSRRGG